MNAQRNDWTRQPRYSYRYLIAYGVYCSLMAILTYVAAGAILR